MVSGPKTIGTNCFWTKNYRKTIGSNGCQNKNYCKTINTNGCFPNIHSMKTIFLSHKIEITRLRVGVGAVKTIKKNISYVQRTKMSHFAFSVGKQFPRGEFMRPRSCLLCYQWTLWQTQALFIIVIIIIIIVVVSIIIVSICTESVSVKGGWVRGTPLKRCLKPTKRPFQFANLGQTFSGHKLNHFPPFQRRSDVRTSRHFNFLSPSSTV